MISISCLKQVLSIVNNFLSQSSEVLWSFCNIVCTLVHFQRLYSIFQQESPILRYEHNEQREPG